MKILFILIAFSFFTGCSSAVRFTSENKPGKKEDPASITIEPVIPVPGKVETGVASYYSKKFNGQKTASGETYNMNELTAAHNGHPFNTKLKVTNLHNNKSVIVRVNDRKPDMHGRLIDVSYAAAKELDMLISGIANVKVEVVLQDD